MNDLEKAVTVEPENIVFENGIPEEVFGSPIQVDYVVDLGLECGAYAVAHGTTRGITEIEIVVGDTGIADARTPCTPAVYVTSEAHLGGLDVHELECLIGINRRDDFRRSLPLSQDRSPVTFVE